MHIEQLTLTQFRLFESIQVAFEPGFNVIHGHNGSGKSSLLEAMFYMARGRSFRTAQPQRMILDQADHFVIRLHLHHPLIQPYVLALQRDKQGKIQAKTGGENQANILAISRHLPTLFLDTNSHRLLASGPKYRRQLLDWGLFYGQSEVFYPLWRRYKRGLAQRNAALKINHMNAYWDTLIVETGEQLDAMRQAYVKRLETALAQLWQSCCGMGQITLRYESGWSQKSTLAEALAAHQTRDQMMGFTQVGPHRADLKIFVDDKPAHQYLSQGQQKMLTYALNMACGLCFHQDTDMHCMYLLDDFCAELDHNKRSQIIEALTTQQSQVVLTGILAHDVDEVMMGRPYHRIQLSNNNATIRPTHA